MRTVELVQRHWDASLLYNKQALQADGRASERLLTLAKRHEQAARDLQRRS